MTNIRNYNGIEFDLDMIPKDAMMGGGGGPPAPVYVTSTASGAPTSRIWILLYSGGQAGNWTTPTLQTSVGIEVYMQPNRPVVGDTPVAVGSGTVASGWPDYIYLGARTTAGVIDNLRVESVKLGAVKSATYYDYVPLNFLNSTQWGAGAVPPLTSQVGTKPANIYLGTDYIYETVETG